MSGRTIDVSDTSASFQNQITINQRMLSAFIGSVLTSFFLTPMDVVRVRVQQQGMLPSCNCPPIVAPAPHLPNTLIKKNSLFWEDQCFKDLNCNNSPTRNFNGMLDAFKKITKYEGLKTLWRGLSLTLLMAIPSNVVYYSGYESLRDVSPLKELFPTINSLACGAFARVIAASVVAPLELLKTRLQSIPASSNSKSLGIMKDLLAETKQEINKIGFKSLYKGLEITLWRDVPFSAIYWGSYELFKKNVWLEMPIFFATSSSDSANDSLGFTSNVNHFLNSFVGGSISGSIAGLVTHPFDVGKTRLQISGKQNDSFALLSNKNMFKYLNCVRKAEGVSALYAGLLPRIIKIAPSCAIMISTYEITKKIFLQESVSNRSRFL